MMEALYCGYEIDRFYRTIKMKEWTGRHWGLGGCSNSRTRWKYNKTTKWNWLQQQITVMATEMT